MTLERSSGVALGSDRRHMSGVCRRPTLTGLELVRGYQTAPPKVHHFPALSPPRLRNLMYRESRLLTGSTEHVPLGELPHTGQELGETAAEEGHTDDGVRSVDVSGGDIEHGEDERR
jgi:hypothetical protein